MHSIINEVSHFEKSCLILVFPWVFALADILMIKGDYNSTVSTNILFELDKTNNY